jgi:hypothetical protein
MSMVGQNIRSSKEIAGEVIAGEVDVFNPILLDPPVFLKSGICHLNVKIERPDI